MEHVKNIPQQKAWVAWEHKEDSASRSTLFSANQLRFPRTIWKDSASVFEESTKTQMLNILGNSTYGFMLNPDASNSNDTRTAKRLSYGLMYANGVPITTPGNVRKPPWAYHPHWAPFPSWYPWGIRVVQNIPNGKRKFFYVGMDKEYFFNRQGSYQFSWNLMNQFVSLYIPFVEAGAGGGGAVGGAPGAGGGGSGGGGSGGGGSGGGGSGGSGGGGSGGGGSGGGGSGGGSGGGGSGGSGGGGSGGGGSGGGGSGGGSGGGGSGGSGGGGSGGLHGSSSGSASGGILLLLKWVVGRLWVAVVPAVV